VGEVYKKTNIHIIDRDLWETAKYKARILGYNLVSEYIFDLIEKDVTGNVFIQSVQNIDEEKEK